MTARRERILNVALALACVVIVRPAESQAPNRDNYYSFVPPPAPIVSQREATVRLTLYGDPSAPSYRDVEVPDGIDDTRARRLVAIAERFSPILRRNNASIPREFESLLAPNVVLNVDTWVDGRRMASDAIAIGPPLPPPRYDGTVEGGSVSSPDADRAIVDLLRELEPSRSSSSIVAPEGSTEKILFFDFPGSNEASWRRAYRSAPTDRAHVYVHFFLEQAPDAAEQRERYDLILQYWFFYPYNDSANNHEGDWEHINVSISTLDRTDVLADPVRLGKSLRADEVARILDNDGTPLDSLSVRMVDYYFHHAVMTLDYVALLAAVDPGSTPHPEHSTTHVWEDADFLQGALRRRLAVAGGRLATHPFGYIGGNNKGPAELLHLWPRFNGSLDRNSHGTYPFPGVWALIGPLGATEKVSGSALPRVKSAATAGSASWHGLLADDHFVTFRANQITLLPDWERIQRIVRDDPAARRRWAWLILPIRFGFPAAKSPAAGVLKRTDTGNTSVITPTFKSSWNRTGHSAESEAFTPTVLRVAGAPVTPWAAVQSGWGILNLPLFAWGLMPGASVAVTQLLPWLTGAMTVAGVPPLRTFVDRPAPLRITSFGQGLYQQFGGQEFALMLPQRPSESKVIEDHLTATNSYIDGNSRSRDTGAGWRLWFNLYYSERFSMENTFGIDTSRVSYQTRHTGDGHFTGRVEGRMILKELTGGIRYNLRTPYDDIAQLYLRAGYAWTAYGVDEPRLNGGAVDVGKRKGGYLPSLLPSRTWWPNTMYGGLGVEMIAPRDRWILHRLGYGVRTEISTLGHRVESKQCQSCGKVAKRGDAAVSVVFSW